MADREALRALYLADEDVVVDALLAQAAWQDDEWARTQALATRLVRAIRDKAGVGVLEAFLQEYALSSEEGVALMCLAEAMMRVPDADTLDALIYDKFGEAKWRRHLGKSDSFWVNAGTWGMLFTGKVVNLGRDGEERLASVFERLLRSTSEPIIRSAVKAGVKMMGRQFILGETIADARKRAAAMEAKGYRYSYDMLGEGARTAEDAERYYRAYLDALEAIGAQADRGNVYENAGLSVKLSAIHPRYEVAQRERCVPDLVEKMRVICEKAKAHNIGITIDAEEAWRLELSMDVIERLCALESLTGWDGLGLAVQAYQKRCPALLDWLIALGRKYGRRFMVRLVKGAYWDGEIKWYQEQGLGDYPLFTRKENTDVSYLANARRMLSAQDAIYPQFATHNAVTVAAILALTEGKNVDFELQRLHGMGEVLHAEIVEHGARKVASRIYAPVGTHRDLLSYLVRRLLENGANSSFVNHVSDESVSVEALVIDPVAQAAANAPRRNANIPLPTGIFAPRVNSQGLDLTFPPVYQRVDAILQPGDWRATSLIAGMNIVDDGEAVYAPADRALAIGRVKNASAEEAAMAVERAQQGFAAWSQTPVGERARLARKLADIYEAHLDEWLRLAVFEAGKIWPDAVAEVREAVDFCRYYADEMEGMEMDGLRAQGVWVCISPWNFPLAIFTGQIMAALMAGNAVVAKPAEQTPLIAHYAVKLMHEAGFPEDAVQLVLGDGAIGAALTQNSAIAGVAFTGSTQVAKLIEKALAADGKARTLIAETGGQNVMVVDSSALPEQVCDAVMSSAFQSAGQRCSALRILCVQDEVYDAVITMIQGALAERVIGNPVAAKVDIGPVIDEKARDKLEAYVAARSDKVLMRLAKPQGQGVFVSPAMIAIDSLDEMGEEQFGPVLHVLRFKSADLPALIADVNALGYGLTGCLHTRIEARQDWFARHLQVGNVYINRNQIGAIVGSQPFGGHGLSGTGPKAGGPLYLHRFLTAQALVVDMAASAGTAMWPSLAGVYDLTCDAQAGWADKAGAQAKSIVHQLKRLWPDAPAAALDAIAEVAEQATKTRKMPGVTGELNQWRTVPRGVLVQRAQVFAGEAFLQTVAALLFGNAVLAENLPKAWAEGFARAGVPQGLLQGVTLDDSDWQNLPLDGLMLSGDITDSARRDWCKRQGAIIPALAVPILRANGRFNADARSFLTLEQSLSVNIAAAGGNIELLAMS
ncbi:MAG: bifunctional proline dehydrogenase/L-glutamate gamma-semialdehyde dehydrogenase PutA [Cardiobacteriaceae bacterium]|nr:bifunctional proline dehydrogenase/L-glutamate gamma-semialdehyde dehydrogenase PutA [Cardiobacteriaceae bacterium]